MEIKAFGVEEWLNQWENDALYDIAGSSIASLTLEEVLELGDDSKMDVLETLLSQKLNYGWIEGSPAFKTEVSKLYESVSPSQILQTNGATGANHLVLYGLIEPGDHVIALSPTYQQLTDIPLSLGAEVSYWETSEEQEWLPSLARLQELIRCDTKMICINNANNPTGAIMDRQFLEELVTLARQVGAYILADEVYRPFEAHLDVPAIVDLYEKGISVNSLSKTYSVPGIRVGWVVAQDTVAEKLRKYRDYTMICAGVCNDNIATHLLKHKEVVLRRNQAIVSQNLQIFKEWVAQEPRVSVVFPPHVSTSLIKLDIPENTKDFCIRLLKDKGVLLVPGDCFEKPGYARLGYCSPTEILKKGLAELSDFLRQYD